MNDSTDKRHDSETEEDLSKGPTPKTRRADGEPEQEHDTSEGPTPETREAERDK
jgi:hypothetical protein